MFIPVIELAQNYNIRPRNILHVGAHLAEESQSYDKYFNVPVLWVEAQPQLCLELEKKLNSDTNTIVEACVSDKDDENVLFNFSSNSQSSSILNFGTHSVNYPDVIVTKRVTVKTKKLETILSGREIPDFINLDIQGVELRAMKSLGNLINQVDVIYTEVNKRKVYEECDLIEEIDYFLIANGFRRVATRWELSAGWGDALYVSKNVKRRSLRQFTRSQLKVYKFYIPQIKNKIKLIIEHFIKKNA
jgi:FkbM family methyltransferase